MSRASRQRAAEAAAAAAAQARARQEAEDRRADEERRRYDEERQKRQTFNAPTNFYGMSGEFNTAAQDWLAKNKDNPTVGAAGADLAYNTLTSSAQRESDVRYAKEMSPVALDYQRGAQGIASDAEDRRIASQGRVDLDRDKLTTDAQRYGYEQQAGAQRYGADQEFAGVSKQAEAQRYVSDTQAGAQRHASDQELAGVGKQTEAQRYVSDTQAGAQRYTSDQEFAGTKYVSDQKTASEREGYQSQERQIGLTGAEQRRTLAQGTEETLALRRDARGAIKEVGSRSFGRSSGRRFYA